MIKTPFPPFKSNLEHKTQNRAKSASHRLADRLKTQQNREERLCRLAANSCRLALPIRNLEVHIIEHELPHPSQK